MRRVAVGGLVGAVIFGLSGCLGVVKKYRENPPLAVYEGTLSAPGLQAPVHIYRDEFAVPHVLAENEPDLFFAIGFIQAQDRLWQLVFNRAFAEGRMSELFGELSVPGVEFKGFPASTLRIDIAQRTMGMKFLGEVGAELMRRREPEIYAQLQAYCDGINYFLDTHPRLEQLPIEFQVLKVRPEPFQPADVVSFGRFMGFFLGYNMLAELLRYNLAEKYGEDLAWEIAPIHGSLGPTIIPPELLHNKLPVPRALPPGGRPPQEELGDTVPLSSKEAGMLFTGLLGLRTLMHMPEAHASNNWVISGKLTETGTAMLANDTHMPHIEPSMWWMMHVRGGRFNAMGATLVGTPYILLGHNQRLAWGATTSIADVQDLFVERTDRDHPGQYYYQGEWRPFTVRKEVIRIRRRLRGGFREKVIEIRQTVHGPIINDIFPLPADAPPVALRWVAWDFCRRPEMFLRLITSATAEEFFHQVAEMPAEEWEMMGAAKSFSLLMRGKSVDDFIAAMDQMDLPSQNWVAADAGGNIAYLPGGLVPIRKKGLGVMPVPGASGEFDWIGFIPTLELPHAINPERGYLNTANNEVVDAEWYPYLFDLNYDSGWRAWRAEELIQQLAPLGLEDMKRIQNDVKVKRAEIEVPIILQAVANKAPTDPRVQRAVAQLQDWDLEADLDSTAAVIFFQYNVELRKNLLADEVSKKDFRKFFSGSHIDIVTELLVQKGTSPLFDDRRTKDRVEDRDDIVVQSLGDAMAWVEKKYGKDPSNYEWGKVHWIKWYHLLGIGPLKELSVGPFPHVGAAHTIRCASPMGSGKAPFKAFNGATFRHLVDMGDVNHSLMVNDGSISGQWRSPHYQDLHQVWLRGDYLTSTLDPEQIKATARYHLVLTPRNGND